MDLVLSPLLSAWFQPAVQVLTLFQSCSSACFHSVEICVDLCSIFVRLAEYRRLFTRTQMGLEYLVKVATVP
jgi:hypothetical protein